MHTIDNETVFFQTVHSEQVNKTLKHKELLMRLVSQQSKRFYLNSEWWNTSLIKPKHFHVNVSIKPACLKS